MNRYISSGKAQKLIYWFYFLSFDNERVKKNDNWKPRCNLIINYSVYLEIIYFDPLNTARGKRFIKNSTFLKHNQHVIFESTI